MIGFFAYFYVLALSAGTAVSMRLRLHDRLAVCLGFAFCLTVFTAFRYNFGYDYFNYEAIITSRDYTGFEYLHQVLFSLSDCLNSRQLYFIITSLTIFSLFIFLALQLGGQYSFLFALLAFVCLPTGYIDSVSIIRQYIAALSFLCLLFYVGRNYLVWLALFSVGILSHFSFALALPLLLVRHRFAREYGPVWHACILVSFPAAIYVVFNSSLVTDNPYLQYMASLDTSGFGFLVINAFVYAAVTIFYVNQKSRDQMLVKVYNCYVCGFALYVGLYQISVHAARMAYYLILLQPFMLAFMFERVGWFARTCLIVFCNLIFLAYLYVSDRNGVRDYLNEFSLRFY